MSFAPRFAAPSTAVSPIEFAALTSAPCSRQSSIASSSDCGDSVYVCATTQLTPDAAISGVVPACVGRFGSAPCSSSKRIIAMSPDNAARRNGVWPVKSTHDTSPSE